jgi:putative intracellular protease/amidase
MVQTPAFQQPIRYADIDPTSFDGVSLTGGHAPGMKQYLESPVLQQKMVGFWKQEGVIGAICHGVLVLARSIDPDTGRSILHGSKVTALTKDLEWSGYALTRGFLGRRYRTYPCYVADEVRQILAHASDFKTGKSMLLPFIWRDGRLVTARWPLDALKYSLCFADMVAEAFYSRQHDPSHPSSAINAAP